MTENILKSLAVLEQNLKDINSAKEQVNNVVKSSSDLAKVIESYQATFESLSVNVKAVLEDSSKFNNESVKKLSEQATNFSKEVAKLTEFDFKDTFINLEKQVVSQFKTDLKEKLDALDNKTLKIQIKIDEFEKQITRLEQVDLESHFKHIQSAITNHLDEQNIELSKKYEEVITKSDNIVVRLEQQAKEFKSLKTLLFLTLGIVIIGIIITFLI